MTMQIIGNKMIAFSLAALLTSSVALVPTIANADAKEHLLNDDLTVPLRSRSRAEGQKAHEAAERRKDDYGAIGGSVEERFAKFQAEKNGRVKHFQDVVNRNHMRKYGEKVR